jgi:hypothetical protein
MKFDLGLEQLLGALEGKAAIHAPDPAVGGLQLDHRVALGEGAEAKLVVRRGAKDFHDVLLCREGGVVYP